MNLQNHRAITYTAAKRAMARIQREGKQPVVDLLEHFWAIYQGSWLTDMCQVTAFFDMAEGRKNPYKVLERGRYVAPKTVTTYSSNWSNLFKALWKKECEWSPLRELRTPESASSPMSVQIIKGYHPYDHFDVVDPVDAAGNLITSEAHEFDGAEADGMIKTAREGIFSYALGTWLYPSFEPSAKRDELFALRGLGHGLHTLQDFYAHSNFVELLLTIASKRGMLDSELSRALALEPFGTYTSFWIADPSEPEATPVMTGRFDRIDTIATLLKILREGLVPPWNDLAAAGYASAPLEARDLLFEAMFGTFSENPFTSQALKLLMTVGDIADAVSALKGTMLRGTLEMFAAVATLFTDSQEIRGAIQEVKGLLEEAATAKGAANYAKAGRILYLERVIEGKLRTDLAAATGPKLPHHTLLAKDKDPSHPEVRLAYNLACGIAVEITTEILYHYARGDGDGSVQDLLMGYFVHPAKLLSSRPNIQSQMYDVSNALYGERWSLFAEDDETRILR